MYVGRVIIELNLLIAVYEFGANEITFGGRIFIGIFDGKTVRSGRKIRLLWIYKK